MRTSAEPQLNATSGDIKLENLQKQRYQEKSVSEIDHGGSHHTDGQRPVQSKVAKSRVKVANDLAKSALTLRATRPDGVLCQRI